MLIFDQCRRIPFLPPTSSLCAPSLLWRPSSLPMSLHVVIAAKQSMSTLMSWSSSNLIAPSNRRKNMNVTGDILIDVHYCNAVRNNFTCSSCYAAFVPAAIPARSQTLGCRHGVTSIIARSSSGGPAVTVQESNSTISNGNVSTLELNALEIGTVNSNASVGAAATASIDTNGSSVLEDRSSDHNEQQQHPSAYIGFGKTLEDGSFRERFVVRFSEAGPRGTITIETLSSLLQEAATNHVISMDYAFTPGRNRGDQITVITRMHMEVDQYPAWRDLLEVDTWFQREGKNAVRRDWIVKEVKTGRQMAFATRCALSEERLNGSSMKITKLEDDASYRTSGLVVSKGSSLCSSVEECASVDEVAKSVSLDGYLRGMLIQVGGWNPDDKINHILQASDKDTDINQHVNNIRYMTWMLESIPDEVKNSHELSKITLEYRQEASQGQPVESMAKLEQCPADTAVSTQFVHLITDTQLGKEINRGRTVWRSLQ